MSQQPVLSELPAGHARAIRHAGARVIQVTRGRLWITLQGDPADYFLHAGEHLYLGSGSVVVEADSGVDTQYALLRQAPTGAVLPGPVAAQPLRTRRAQRPGTRALAARVTRLLPLRRPWPADPA